MQYIYINFLVMAKHMLRQYHNTHWVERRSVTILQNMLCYHKFVIFKEKPRVMDDNWHTIGSNKHTLGIWLNKIM